jgi:hypothetical protein
MDFGLIFDVVWKLGTLLGFGWMYMSNRDKVTNGRITKLQDDLDTKLDVHANRLTRLEAISAQDISERVATLEQHATDAPKHSDLARLHARIDEVAGAIKRIEGENTAQTRILNLVYESLIKGPK